MRLKSNQGIAFKGSTVLGMGFVLQPDEAMRLLLQDEQNKTVVCPYLTGEDLNSHPEQEPSRWIINFGTMDQDSARHYEACFNIVRERVYEYRKSLAERNQYGVDRANRWWQFDRPTEPLYSAIEPLERVIVFAQTSKTKYPAFKTKGIVFDQKTVVIASDQSSVFSLMCSHVHPMWALQYGSSLRTDAVYAPSDCFETFPFPPTALMNGLTIIGEIYNLQRSNVMRIRQEGLTKTYNRFHHPAESAADIQQLRDLHVEMDKAVASAYGWSDLDLVHGFHETRQGTRFTISEAARCEVLARLLKLNHQRYAEEVAQSLHDKKKGKARSTRAKPKADKGNLLFD